MTTLLFTLVRPQNTLLPAECSSSRNRGGSRQLCTRRNLAGWKRNLGGCAPWLWRSFRFLVEVFVTCE
ncbi:hypothetical protein KFK09_023545 [Dendrobium nobile]|uniref:Uncharacterized protein n=1 Tax=Dendrobium nobile TaxID=94219 RepID=A0A8T3ABC1_DENNO|nr:hypothetical protein KFK09_023545 [Dendrobium nobile]